MQWACMTASYVAQELDYQAKDLRDWQRCHEATRRAFHAPEQFEQKFEALIHHIRQMGFQAVELWGAHFDASLVTPKMIDQANKILDKYEMNVVSYAAGFGEPNVSRETATQIFETAHAIGAPVLAQEFHPSNGELVQELAEQYSIRMALENHFEKTPREVIDIVAPFSPWVGSAIDTGWFGTQGYDAVQAVHDLSDHIVHVHLKDVLAVGGHDSCTFGDGVVDVKGVLSALQVIEYTGSITVELEAMDMDPTEQIKTSLKRAQTWWNEI